MRDGQVEGMDRTLLSLLRTYTESHGDWEEHLQLMLFVYHTTKHSSTQLSPHVQGPLWIQSSLHICSHLKHARTNGYY